MKKKINSNYLKVVTAENKDSADILLYGVIGQDFWWDEDLNEESITDLSFIKKLRELEEKYNRINIRINSPGGSMFHGNAIITAMQSSKAEIHTYNDGLAASMAGDIWLAGSTRHMAKNSLLMIHAPSSIVWGNAKQMRQEAMVLDKFEHTAIVILAEATGMSEEEVKAQFYDYEDHWFTAKECQELNFISEAEEYEVEEIAENVSQMTHHQLVKLFAEQGDEEAKTWLDKIGQKIKAALSSHARTNKVIISNIKSKEMTVNEFKQSLEGEELSIDDVSKVLKERGYEVVAEEPVKTAAPDMETIIQAAVTKAVTPLQEEIATIKSDVQKLGDMPAEEPTKVLTRKDPASDLDAEDPLKKYNEEAEAAAVNGQNPFVGNRL